ncbi:hypothetical protein ADL05_09165 [Nocardiopsis sp. NRRL B-16309]|nr:hypothetical protein ADL05_09165 [Nocardiopsis sp. NRRL B-16309]
MVGEEFFVGLCGCGGVASYASPASEVCPYGESVRVVRTQDTGAVGDQFMKVLTGCGGVASYAPPASEVCPYGESVRVVRTQMVLCGVSQFLPVRHRLPYSSHFTQTAACSEQHGMGIHVPKPFL